MFRGCNCVAVLNLDVKETNVELGSTSKKTKKGENIQNILRFSIILFCK